MAARRLSQYAKGYQDALAELVEILERDGEAAMYEYLTANYQTGRSEPVKLDLSPHAERRL